MTISIAVIDYLKAFRRGWYSHVYMATHKVYELLLSLEGPFAWCLTGKKMEENICFSENVGLTAKQRGTSNQWFQNSQFWDIWVLGLPNAKRQLLGMPMKESCQNRGSEPGKRATPYQCLPHGQIQTFVGCREKGLVSPVPQTAFPILVNSLD